MSFQKVIILSVSLFLSACSGLGSKLQNEANNSSAPAKLLNYSIDEKFVHIDVMSNGCTLMTSFELLLVDKRTNSIEVMRKKPDTCIVKPIKVSLGYPYRHLGVDDSKPIRLVNPLFNDSIASFD